MSGYENREVRVSRLNLGPCMKQEEAGPRATVQHPWSTLPPDGSSICGDTFNLFLTLERRKQVFICSHIGP